MDIGTGAGLAGATGVRPFLPPLLAGALARGDIGISFDGTDVSFLETPGFLAGVLALAAISYALERRRGADRRPDPGARRIDPLDGALALIAAVLGAMLFAGALEHGHNEGWPGVVGGILCSALGYLAVAALFARARRRLSGGAAALLVVYADAIALVLAAVAILIPPVALVALAAFCVVIARGRSEGASKYQGLRILR
ncbi:MAG: hypothetical protein NVSMB25_00750 [Thermoleophilaceae bacterium]